MKFHWGTGILIFLILFLSAAAAFIVFAFHQGVNLVERDYYDKGVDYTNQMEIDARSAGISDAIHTWQEDGYLVIDFSESLVPEIDSGEVVLFRPSDSKLDLKLPLALPEHTMKIPGAYLI